MKFYRHFLRESWLGFAKASVTCSSIWGLEKQDQDSSVMKFHNLWGEILCRRHSPHFIKLWLPSNGLPHHCEAGTFWAIKQVPDQLFGNGLVGNGSTCQIESLFFSGELVTSSQIKTILKYDTLDMVRVVH